VLVDGEPTTIFATYEESGRGALEIRGKKDGENFYLEVAVDLEDESERPAIEKLWAQARIRELERASVGGRRAETMKERIIKLAQQYGVSSKHTSFVVVEKRTGERRMHEQPSERVVPVAMPAGWAMSVGRAASTRAGGVRTPYPSLRPCAARSAPMRAMSIPGSAQRPAAGMPPPASMRLASPAEADATSATPIGAGRGDVLFDVCAPAAPPPSSKPHPDPVLAILSRQSASGLWEEGHRDPIELTVQAMLSLVRLGLSSRHMIHGAQIKKAVDALLVRLAANRATDVRLREIALGVAWLLATGPRTRSEIEAAAKGSALAVTFGNEPAVRAHVERLAI
jgi:Ca-activated chloride channel family protein